METLKRTKIVNVLKSDDFGSKVCVKGWVRTKRGSKNVAFIALNDGSTINNIQIVADLEQINESILSRIHTGACLSVTGTLIASQGSGQKVEIAASAIEVLGEANPDEYPLQPKKHSLEFLREKAHLRFRTSTFSAVFRIRHAMAFAIHQFFNGKGFYYMHSPIITGSDAEGAGEMFQVTTLDLDKLPRNEEGKVDYSKDFFGKLTNLTVSGQLEGELAALALGEIYTFGPTFRAENSNTSRHLAEFWMIEPEIAFADINDDMDLAEAYLKYVIAHLFENCASDMVFFDKFIEKGLIDRLKNVINNPFERITYTQAIELLEKAPKKFEFPVKWGCDLQSEHERYLTEELFKKPVIVTGYPKEIKAFYMRRNKDDKTVAAMDVLVPGIGELIGGSQREERLDVLEKRLEEMQLDKKNYWWYLELRKYGSIPHAGFGVGFERLVLFATGMENIRDVIP